MTDDEERTDQPPMISTSICTNCGEMIDPVTNPSTCPVCGSSNRQSVVRDEQVLDVSETVTVAAFTPYAEAWFDDAVREAAPQTAGDPHARRREIVFSVMCAESYLPEWVGTLLQRRFSGRHLYEALRDYFPTPAFGREQPLSLPEKWLEIPERLSDEGFLTKRLRKYKYTTANTRRFEEARLAIAIALPTRI